MKGVIEGRKEGEEKKGGEFARARVHQKSVGGKKKGRT